MLRLSSRRTFVILVIVVLGLTVIIMSRSHSGENGQSLGFSPSESKEDVEMHYYSNQRSQGRNKNLQNSHNNIKPDEIVDYPFEEENDFDPLSSPGEEKEKKLHHSSEVKGHLEDAKCNINNGKFIIDCKRISDEVYVPFSFLKKYYEIYGKWSESKTDTFLWFHTPPIKIYKPKKPYDPKGVFAFFDNYNVEVRDRVKCISGKTGVPVSTQWDAHGYFYPIQIAQFGLSHYSKYITEKAPTRITLENGSDIRGKWMQGMSSVGGTLRTVPDPENKNNQVLAIKAFKRVDNTNSEDGVKLPLDSIQRHLLILSFDIRSARKVTGANTVNVTISVKAKYESQEFYLHYVTDDFFIKIKGNHIYHGLGLKSGENWQHVIRDIGVDLQKGTSVNNGSKKKGSKIPRSKIILDHLWITNENLFDVPLLIDNMTISSSEHLNQFFQAVDWFVSYNV